LARLTSTLTFGRDATATTAAKAKAATEAGNSQ